MSGIDNLTAKNMKRFSISLAAMLLACTGFQMEAQSLKDLLNKDNIKKVVETVVDKLDVIPENITGTWEYT